MSSHLLNPSPIFTDPLDGVNRLVDGLAQANDIIDALPQIIADAVDRPHTHAETMRLLALRELNSLSWNLFKMAEGLQRAMLEGDK